MGKIIAGLALILSGLLMSGCGQGFESSSYLSSAHSSSLGGTVGLPPVGSPEILIAKSTDLVTSELATSHKVVLTVTPRGFTGSVDVKIESPELDAVDVKDGIKVTSNMPVVALSSGTPTTVELTIEILSSAPSVTNQHFHVILVQAGTQVAIAEAEVNLTVTPIFRIQIMGAGDAGWLVNGKAINTLFNSQTVAREIEFVHHVAGVQVIFENASMAARRIHSSGPLAHQATASAVGETYMPAPIIGNAMATSGVYLHNDESAGLVRRLVFNANL